MPSSRDDYVLLTLNGISHGCGLAAGGELIFPEFFSCFNIEGAQDEIHGGGSEDQASGSDHRAT